MSHYKTNAPAVLATFDRLNAEMSALQDRAAEFRDHFGAAKCCFSNQITSFCFHGLVFNPPMPATTWIHPDKYASVQYPRKKVTGLTDQEKADHKALLADWSKRFPADRINITGIYESFGSDWGNCLMNGIGYFQGADGFVYVSTGATLGDHMQSIPEWEYIKAKAEKGGAA